MTILVDVDGLRSAVVDLLHAAGVDTAGAEITADCLLSAELDGVSSHGIALLPLYLDKLQAGGVAPRATIDTVSDAGAFVVLDANHCLGPVSSARTTDLVLERAARHGIGYVAVRNAFHFGAAAFWTRRLAGRGVVGVAMSNTRPLMPAPGGARALVGNNPLSIAFPSTEGAPVVVDMAMSATAMGKIRLADAAGQPIPSGWATDAAGQPTTSARDAIAGMLLPAAGPKGFGLAVAIDLLCGGLSGGAVGPAVKPLYGDPARRYECAHAFLAIDPRVAEAAGGIAQAADAFAHRIREADRAAGVDRLFAPGDIERANRASRERSLPLPSALAQQIETRLQALEPGRSLPILPTGSKP